MRSLPVTWPSLATGLFAVSVGYIAPFASAQNLLANGNFEQGNSGFNTQLTYLPGGFLENADYDVNTNPILVHDFSGTASYGDHTSGAGKFLIVDSPTNPATFIWSETVPVNPSQDYKFDGWISSWSGGPYALLQIAVNGTVQGQVNGPTMLGTWQPFSFGWPSGSEQSATITITDLQPGPAPDAFGLDDLSFSVPQATTLSWNNAGGTGDGKTWDVASNQNWTDGNPEVFIQLNNVVFGDKNNGNYDVAINSVVTPTSVTFTNNTGNYILSGSGGIGGAIGLNVTGSGMVTLSTTNAYTGPTTVTGGMLVIAAAAALPTGAAVTVGGGTSPAILQLAPGIGQANLSSLTINPGGVFDITNNKLVINYAEGADPVATIRRYLKSAYNGGIWTGPGLTSSTVQSQVAGAIAHGGGVWSIGYEDLSVDTVDPAATQLFIEPALVGDANLDGSVTFIDLGIVAQNLGAINTDWEHGDFNFDGTTNFLDIGLLAQNLSKTILNTPLSEMIPDPSAALTAQWNLAVAELEANETQPTNLPEPGVIGLLVIGAAGLLTRRRRNQNCLLPNPNIPC